MKDTRNDGPEVLETGPPERVFLNPERSEKGA